MEQTKWKFDAVSRGKTLRGALIAVGGAVMATALVEAADLIMGMLERGEIELSQTAAFILVIISSIVIQGVRQLRKGDKAGDKDPELEKIDEFEAE